MTSQHFTDEYSRYNCVFMTNNALIIAFFGHIRILICFMRTPARLKRPGRSSKVSEIICAAPIKNRETHYDSPGRFFIVLFVTKQDFLT